MGNPDHWNKLSLSSGVPHSHLTGPTTRWGETRCPKRSIAFKRQECRERRAGRVDHGGQRTLLERARGDLRGVVARCGGTEDALGSERAE